MSETMTLDEAIKLTKEQLEQSSKVAAMMKHEGWQILSDHFQKILKVTQDQLLVESDVKQIRRLQERYRAFSSMIQAAHTFAFEREKCLQELASLEEHKKFNQDFGLDS